MIKTTYFSQGNTEDMKIGKRVESVVEDEYDKIKSTKDLGTQHKSNKTLKILSDGLELIGFDTETKSDTVLKDIVGVASDGTVVTSEMDAYHPEENVRIEVENSLVYSQGYTLYRNLSNAKNGEKDINLLVMIVPIYNKKSNQVEEAYRKVKQRCEIEYQKNQKDFDLLLIGY